MDETLPSSPVNEQGELLIINGNPEVGEHCMFGRGVYLSVFNFFGCIKDISMDFSEE